MAPPSNYRRRVTKAQQAASERYYKHLGGVFTRQKKEEDRRYAAKMKRDRERAETAAHNKAFFGTMGDIFNIGKKAIGVLGSLKKGGKVKKTGLYKLHKNEVVLTQKQMKMYEKKKKKKKPAKRKK